MREVYKAPADVSTEVHYPWGVWDLISLKERCPDPEQDPDKFIDYFLTSLRAQKANWADTKVLLQKLIPAAKFRDIMAFWDWGDDLLSTPTFPKRRDGSGNIAEGLRGNDARTTELVKDIKHAFPKKPPLQRLEKCVFEKGDTAYTFMDKTREAFSQIMGSNVADAAEFRPFILNHYVNHLPLSVSQKIKATVGWESFALDVVCAHAAHHLQDLGTDKRDKKDRLLALQISHLESAPPGYRTQTNPQGIVQYVPRAHRGGDRRHHNNRNRGGGAVAAPVAAPAQGVKPCSRCGGYSHYARFCMAVMAAPGQQPAGVPGQQAGPPQGQQIALGLPPNPPGALNVYAPPFYQPTYPSSNQQVAPAPGHQQQQQFRTA